MSPPTPVSAEPSPRNLVAVAFPVMVTPVVVVSNFLFPALYIDSNHIIFRKYNTSEVLSQFVSDGAVTLYYDDSAKLATSNTGVTITGNATATKFLGDGSALTGIGGDMDITSSLFV